MNAPNKTNKPDLPIPFVNGDDLDPTVAAIFANLQQSMGMVPTLYRVMGHAPAVLEASQTWTKAIGKDQDLRLKEIAYIHTSALNHCEYCLEFHRKVGAKAGLCEKEIALLEEIDREDWSAFAPKEQNIILFARAWTLRLEIGRPLIDALVHAFGPKGTVAIAAAVHQANWTNRFSALFVPQPGAASS